MRHPRPSRLTRSDLRLSTRDQRKERRARARALAMKRCEKGARKIDKDGNRVPWTNAEYQARWRARQKKAQIDAFVEKRRETVDAAAEGRPAVFEDVVMSIELPPLPDTAPMPATLLPVADTPAVDLGDIAADLVATLEALAATLPEK